MAKNHKRLKRLKSEKAKVKLKAKKSVNQIPKSLNITNTSFKVKKILLPEQLKHRGETEIGICKLNINDLLTRFRHYNSTVREDALKQLKNILLQNSKSLHSQLSSLLRGIAALSLDKEKNVRRSCFNALNVLLGLISNEQLLPLREVVISYLSCAMTHIDPRIKEDSLLFLDVLVQNCNSVLAKDSHKILPNFLGMICKLHNEAGPDAKLTTMLNSKNTTVKWRIKVLERLANIFTSVVNYRKFYRNTHSNPLSATKARTYTKYVPIYSNNMTQICEVNLDINASSSCTEEILPIKEFEKYVGLLMPLMFDIWLEVCPDEKVESYTEITISSEAATLLKHIVIIIQSIIEYIDTLDHDNCSVMHIKYWFKNRFHNTYMKNFLSKFPYGEVKRSVSESKRRQEDFSQVVFTEKCLVQNLGLCQIHVWFTSLFDHTEQFCALTKNNCESVATYLNGVIENSCDSSAIPQLTNLLRVLFLKASPVWYANCINLSHTLQLIIEASSSLPNKELQSRLCLIVGDIMLENNLNELHREKVFKNFVKILPSLLLRSSINDVTIRMISQIVLRFKDWIQEELVAKHEAIIENAKKIVILDSYDDRQSRLMIYNLFYFIDSQIYY
ncbi:hypothetical protein P5V15_007461 [Pogonomyrmex californicus]